VVADLLADRGALAAMGEAARRVARPDAVARIADQAEAWAARGPRARRGPDARRHGLAAGGGP
jgi:hypothetical protein